MLKPILFAAAALASAVSISPAFAKPVAPPTRIVSYADLDLNTTAGQARLDRRIAAAVRQVCGEAANFELARRQAVRDCIADTSANVRRPAPAVAGTR